MVYTSWDAHEQLLQMAGAKRSVRQTNAARSQERSGELATAASLRCQLCRHAVVSTTHMLNDLTVVISQMKTVYRARKLQIFRSVKSPARQT